MRRWLWLIALLWCSPAWATWTLIQVKDNASCASTATCAVTVTATGAHNLLVAGMITNGSETISSVTAGACNTTWTHAPNSALGVTADGWVDLYYCTDSVASITSISITVSTNWTSGPPAVIWEAHSTLGSIAIDSGATPSGTKNNSTNCLSCGGVSLTLSGNNDFIVGLAACGQTCTGLTGTGWTNDLSNVDGDGVAHGITTGSQTAPATWTQTPTGTMVSNAAAFKEASGASSSTPQVFVILP